MTTLYRTNSLRGKWLFIALMALTLQVSAKSDQDSARVTINETNISIEAALLKIEAQTGLTVFYAKQHLSGSDVLSKVSIRNASIGDALSVILNGKGLTWKIKDGGVTIIKKNDEPKRGKQLVVDTLPRAVIKGTVTTDDGYPLAGASVQIKGTGKGVVTNSRGQFSLDDVARDASVVVSYTGYLSQRYEVKTSETLVVKLKRDIGTLDEQVVIAYGTSSKRKLTGSIGRITEKEIEKQPVLNPLQALQGRMAGVQINQISGMPGGNFEVLIRGQNSLRNTRTDNGNRPLYIVDGVPYFSATLNAAGLSPTTGNTSIYPGESPLNNINPSDITSIEVLRDADATAIYGSRGANGVVLITTKKGQAGAMKASGNIYTGVGEVTRKMKILSTDEYLMMRREAFSNDGIAPSPADYDVNGTWKQDKFTDWQETLIGGNAKYLDGQLSISGGTPTVQYLVSGGYHRETSVYPGDNALQRASFHSNITASSLNQRFTTSISINYSANKSSMIGQDLTQAALTLAPNAPELYGADGNLNWENNTFQNPLQYTKQPYEGKGSNFIVNGTLSYEVLKGLRIKSNMGIVNTNLSEHKKIYISSYMPLLAPFVTLQTNFGNSKLSSWIVEPQLTYQRNVFGGRLDVLLGTSFQQEQNDQLAQNAQGFPNESLMENIAAADQTKITSSYSYYKYKYTAIFGRIGYDWKTKYLVNLTGRRDGSSRFGPGRQFGNFGAIGGAWIFSEEDFFRKAMRMVSYGKLRASYGTTGSDQIGNYGYLDSYTSVGAGQYQLISALAPSRLYNPDFRWEVNRKFEAALEIGLLNDRVFVSGAFYRNRSSNQLVGYPLPPSTGFTTVNYNLDATVQNTGWEIETRSTNIKSSNVTWTSSFNISIPSNKLISFPGLAGSSYGGRLIIGEPITISQRYRFMGVSPETGLYTFEDIDKNGILNVADRIATVNFAPKFYGGLQNSISYKAVSLEMLFQFAKQLGVNYLNAFGARPGAFVNQPDYVLNRWKVPGDVTDIQKFSNKADANTAFNNLKTSDRFYSDASFIRLKNVSLSYTIPSALFNRKVQLARVYLQCQNLWTITDYEGLDPENNGIIALPPLRVITAGIQISL